MYMTLYTHTYIACVYNIAGANELRQVGISRISKPRNVQTEQYGWRTQLRSEKNEESEPPITRCFLEQ